MVARVETQPAQVRPARRPGSGHFQMKNSGMGSPIGAQIANAHMIRRVIALGIGPIDARAGEQDRRLREWTVPNQRFAHDRELVARSGKLNTGGTALLAQAAGKLTMMQHFFNAAVDPLLQIHVRLKQGARGGRIFPLARGRPAASRYTGFQFLPPAPLGLRGSHGQAGDAAGKLDARPQGTEPGADEAGRRRRPSQKLLKIPWQPRANRQHPQPISMRELKGRVPRRYFPPQARDAKAPFPHLRVMQKYDAAL